ncbi:hypothetical protein GCM10011348_29090 [Marinobacterium nitratireducens]|uniref:Transcriptional regulator n=1 Tax=Marinobacterium nitratireducens TaxID=518897 RepID=A0A918DUN2_9GAMM|nr:DUF4160 domain-containing protein [Marinobacterium nitratireducens]GGO83959.1 hypothetical protein GCM10011348_29090 [Marinobacterium nitratireducens]
MPHISDYLGLVFYIYFHDHKPPHVHVRFGEFNLVVEIQTAAIREGYLPSKKRKLAQQIVERYRDELLEKWNQAQAGQHPGKLEITL